jgi:S-adenosylmethionine synthetase
MARTAAESSDSSMCWVESTICVASTGRPYAHKILKDLADARKAKSGDAAKLGPDAKSQVTVITNLPVGLTCHTVPSVTQFSGRAARM